MTLDRLASSPTMPSVPSELDHLVYGAPDLDSAVEALEALLGVRATPGGRHEGVGTHNALIALGESAYLEVIAPDPTQPPPGRPRPFGLDRLVKPRLVTWAIKAPGIDAAVERARAAGHDPGEVRAMSRATPDGRRLEWRLATPREPVCAGLVPFLIDWGETPSPATTAAQGCRLAALWAEYPNPRALRAYLRTLGVELEVRLSPRPRLVATMECPRGVVELA
ncbi:MAG: VOC family protein [Dehalococcoidia bacterium]